MRFVVIAILLSVGQRLGAQTGSPSLDRPCSFVSKAEMTSLLGMSVDSVADEHFRCKYVVGKGWLETKLMNFELKATKDILEYNKAHGKPMPGVGDQAYLLGATLAAKLGDVVVVVDGSNVRSADNAKLKAIALKIIKQIP